MHMFCVFVFLYLFLCLFFIFVFFWVFFSTVRTWFGARLSARAVADALLLLADAVAVRVALAQAGPPARPDEGVVPRALARPVLDDVEVGRVGEVVGVVLVLRVARLHPQRHWLHAVA